MNKLYLASLLAGIGAVAAASPQTTHLKSPGHTPPPPGPDARMEFIANLGQWDSHVKFLGRSPGVDMWITDQGVSYSYYRATGAPKAPLTARFGAKPAKPANPSLKFEGHVVRVGFDGADKIARTQGMGKKGYFLNYYVGNDRTKWRAHVPVYSSVKVNDLYKGVDLVAYFDPIKKRPRYDLVVKPGADASKIAMRYEGVQNLGVGPRGALAYKTSLGQVEERDLFAYQPAAGYDIDRGRTGIAKHDAKTLQRVTPVKAQVRMDEDGAVRFALGRRNASESLVIDPIVWATYLNGDSPGAYTFPYSLAVGSDDSIYVSGQTYAPTYPATPGAYSAWADGTYAQNYASRLSSDGTTLLSSTVFGSGTGNEYQIIVAPCLDGSFAVAGVTYGSGYPITPNAWQATYADNNGNGEGFVTKFSADGAMVFSTFLAHACFPLGIATGSDGAIYTAGAADPAFASGIVTPNAAYTSMAAYGGYCAKLLPDGSGLEFGTYTPGAIATALALDSAGNMYLGGNIGDNSFTATPGSFGPFTGWLGFSQGLAFVMKIHSDGSRYDYSGQYGSQVNYGYLVLSGIAVDPSGSVYIGGHARENTIPITPGAYATTRGGGSADAFVAKVAPDGRSLAYSTFFPSIDHGATDMASITVDSFGRACIAGRVSEGGHIPLTSGALQTASPNMFTGSYLAQLSPDGQSLVYSTYYGAPTIPVTAGMRALSNDDMAVSANVYNLPFPTTAGTFHPLPPSPLGVSAQVVARIRLSPGETTMGVSPVQGNSTARVTGNVWLPAKATMPTMIKLSTTSTKVVVPKQILVPAGQFAGSFSATYQPVDSDTSVDIRATVGSSVLTRTVTIKPAVLNGFTISAASAVGERSVSGKVTLDGVAGPSGVTVSLSSSDPSVANVPASVTIPSGKQNATFNFSTNPTASGSTTIQAHGDNGPFVGSQTISVSPVLPSAIGLSMPTLYNGQSTAGRVRLNTAAPSGGLTVDLSVPDDYKPYFPAQVVVPKGASYADFAVSIDSTFAGPDASFALTATANGTTVTTNVNLKTVQLGSIRVSPGTLYGGYFATVTVTLNHAAPAGGITVDLASNSPSVMVSTPITIIAGTTTGWVYASTPLALAAAETVTISATAGGVTKTVPITIRPLLLAGFTSSVTTVKGGTGANLTVTLNAPTVQDVVVQLHSDSASASLPATVTIPAGSQSVTVPLATSAVANNAKVNLTASFLSVTRTLTIVVSK